MTLLAPAPDLRRRLWRAFGVLLALLAFSGAIGIGTLIIGVRNVNELVNESQPLLERNSELLQLMTDAETSQRGYRLTGNARFLEPFVGAVAAFPQVSGSLSESLAEDAALDHLLQEQVERADAWLNGFALPLVERLQDDPSAADDPSISNTGKSRFDAFRTANNSARAEITARRDAAQREVHDATLAAGGVFVSVLAAGVVLGAVVARRTTDFVAHPLEQLRATIGRLSAGDLSARSSVEGPAETQAVSRAVNELADTNERFQAMQAETLRRMEELDQARADFVSSVSHELRTPLTSVTGYAEMLSDGEAGELTADQAKMVQIIDRNARRLLALVEDLLTVSRIEAGAQRMGADLIDVGTLVEGAVEAIRPSLEGRQLVLDIDGGIGAVIGDRAQLDRVLLNLLSNAVKFTPLTGKVTLAAGRRDGSARIEVSDTGIGIPLAEQPRMFERFFRSSSARDAVIPGTGLGLTIVKSIVEAHGGSIGFDSVPREGTTFAVTLPVAPAKTDER